MPRAGNGGRSRLSAAAALTARPHLCQERLTELEEALGMSAASWDEAGLAALAAVLAGSEAVARYLKAEPSWALPLCAGTYVRDAKPALVMRDELRRLRAAARSEDDWASSLPRYRTREWVRITARELSRIEPVESILEELSNLAYAIIDAAIRYLLRRDRSRRGPRLELTQEGPRPAGFVVVAQGKLGASELNLSSDVDLQLIYSSDNSLPTAERSLHERFLHVGQRLLAVLSRRDAHGFCYRVDTELRPEGKKGSLVNSVAGAEAYYENFGQTWERLALIRAQRAGGAAWVYRSFAAAVRPFVYPRSLHQDAVEEIRALKDRLHREQRLRALSRGAQGAVDIKRDPGCIREIELFVQILQLLHGGRDANLRTRRLLETMARLHFAGHLSEIERTTLEEAYRFLRRLENALQAQDELQTHSLPSATEARTLIARMLGFAPPSRAATKLSRELAQGRKRVQTITERLFGADEGDALARRLPDAAERALSQQGAPQLAALARLGFADPQEAANILAALGAQVGTPFSRHAPERLRRLGPAILIDIVGSPDGEQALRLLADLLRALRLRPAYFELLLESPPLRHRLFDLLGTSEFLGRAIALYPELIDRLAELNDPVAAATGAGVLTHTQNLSARIGRLGDLELKLRSLRRFKLEEILRVGFADVAGLLDIEACLEQLSDIAEGTLRLAYEVARRSLRDAPFAQGGFAILGLGRLGAREMGYGSDLDLLFVFDDSADGVAREAAIRLAQTLIRQLTYTLEEGPLYAIDTRLRPSGHQGPLVSSSQGFVSYHRERAMLWERQALLRARPVAGDLELGARLLEQLADVRYPKSLPPESAAEMHRMRERIERELASKAGANVKTGKGGIADIEFVVHYLILKHASSHPPLRTTNTFAALRAAEATGVLSPRRARTLQQAYRFLRNLENRLRIVHDRPIDEVSMGSSAWGPLARRMGYPHKRTGATQLLRDYEATTARVRRIYEQVVRP